MWRVALVGIGVVLLAVAIEGDSTHVYVAPGVRPEAVLALLVPGGP